MSASQKVLKLFGSIIHIDFAKWSKEIRGLSKSVLSPIDLESRLAKWHLSRSLEGIYIVGGQKCCG